MKKILYILFNVSLFLPLAAHADLICKGKRLNGFSKYDVLRYCGKPLMKDSYLKAGRLSSQQGQANQASPKNVTWTEVQQWFYVSGHQKTSYTVEFEGGNITIIIKGKDKPL
ncbi:hypothetical protein MNBD_GAMMA09-1253 [hydrothermal vent metagenome]|uniref:DUF2845 domain-containing protein n=1 Tax=hydrothermal vent metagenome TaxID=652676 RepID=A0A3B0XD42_9ZZZZ